MTQEWTELKTLQEVAAAQERGDEIEVIHEAHWIKWTGFAWHSVCKYRSRPRKKVKKIVLREALFYRESDDSYWTAWYSADVSYLSIFVRWLDTPERIVEIEE